MRRPKQYRVSFKFYALEFDSFQWIKDREYTTGSVAWKRCREISSRPGFSSRVEFKMSDGTWKQVYQSTYTQ